MFKKLFSLTALSLLGLGLYAQDNPLGQSNEVVNGANGAKTTFLRKATAANPEFLSYDNRYFSGLYGTGAGYAYDLVKDTMYAYEFMVSGIAALDHYVGQSDPGDTYANSFVHYKGQNFPLEKVINYTRASYNEVFVQTVQGNCEKIVTMVYDTTTHYADGRVALFNRVAVYDGTNGKCLMQLPYVWNPPIDDDSKFSFGSRGDCISGDGAIIGGHSANPNANRNWSLAFWDISDPNDIKAFGFGEAVGLSDNGHAIDLSNNGYSFGSFWGANYDGSLLVGGSQTNGYGVIVHYDRAKKEVSQIDTIAPLPSWDFLTFTAVSNDGVAIGYCGLALDPGTREAVVYTELTGLVKMTDFLYEYYDIDIRKSVLYSPLLISRDGLLMIGHMYDDEGSTLPYVHQLSTVRLYPRARKISARALRGEQTAVITWQEPLTSEHTLTGYNIYLDDATTPLNTTPLAASEGSYTDKTVSKGKHTYYIEAVYADGTARKQASNIVQVVGADDAFPVQSINDRVDYNRFANIYWGLPSSEVVALAKNDIVTPSREVKGQFDHAAEAMETSAGATAEAETKNSAKSYTSTTLDYIANIDMLTYSGYVAIKIGDLYYTSSHTTNGITIIDQFNETVGIINPKDLGNVTSMVYMEDENLLYCGTNNEVKVIDLDDPTKIKDNYNVPGRFLAYVPELDGGNGGFVAGKAHECNTYIWKDGDLVLDQKNIIDFSSIYAMGAAYHNGRLYVSSSTGYYYNEVYVYDFAKKEQIGEPIQVVEDPALYNLLTLNGNEQLVNNLSSVSMAGGLSVCQLEDGTTALGMVFQCSYMTSRFMLLEMESSADLKGYNLYRSVNGGNYVKLNDAPMTSRRYEETLTDAGRYTYYVEVLSEKTDEPSEPSPVDTIVISEHSACPAPDFSVKESNGWAFLEWMPNASSNALVGFDIYRDDNRIARFWINDMCFEYIDEEVAVGGSYTYRLDVVYGDGCVGAKTIPVTLTGQGLAKEPFGLTLRAEGANKTQDHVFAEWETPMFEEPLVLRYCNGFDVRPVGFENFYECWGAIAWAGSELDLYRDLYLVGMEYGIGNTPTTYEAIVILNDKLVYTQPVQRPVANGFQTVMFDKSFPMDQPQEVVVGFHTTYSAETNGVLLTDPTVTIDGRSNLATLDGRTWSTLKVGGTDGSWLLSALVVHKRDLDAAKNADGTIDGTKLAGCVTRMAMEGQPLGAKIETLPNTTLKFKPSAKAGLNLTGFNVYRRQAEADAGKTVKLNSEPITSLSYTDWFVPIDEYEYTVSALYADGQEIKAKKYIDLTLYDNEDMSEALSLNVYPNPATEWINVEGEYETLQIFDFGGRLLRTVPAAKQIQLGDLKPGTYLLHFTGADARKAIYKIVVR